MTQPAKQDRNRFFSPVVKEKEYEPLIEKRVNPQAIRQLH
jgi:hypothetical protein